MIRGTNFLSTVPLLNEVSQKKSRNLKRSFRNFLRNSLRNLPRNSPPNFSCFPGRLTSPPQKFHHIFPIGNLKFQIGFQIKCHQKFHKHTSAGLAALKYSHEKCSEIFPEVFQPLPRTSKFPSRLFFFLSDTVWQTGFLAFSSDEICLVELGQWLSD